MKRLISTVLGACVLAPLLAFADPTTADGWYKEGENQYNLGNFPKAIDAFKKGFELEPADTKKAAYLFNIAQAYRQLDDCKEAVFFYKRYLAFKDADKKKPLKANKRKEIEDRIKELDACAQQQDAIRKAPPDQNPDTAPDTTPDPKPDTTPDPKPDPKVVGTIETGPQDDPEPRIVERATDQPKLLSLRATAGGTKVTAGELPVPVQATAALIGGYPLALGNKLTVEIGAGFTFTPVPFDGMNGESKTAQLIGLVANVGGTYAVAPKLGVRGDLGIGALVFSGASESPFTDFAATSGALTMLHVRVGVSADYAITPNVIATATPLAFSFSPAKAGLQSNGQEISTITSIDFMIGIGYRM
jgi:hypothetical protein